MSNTEKKEIIDISIDYRKIGDLYVYIVKQEMHKIQFIGLRDMLEYVRGVFLQHSNDEVNLSVTPACNLLPEDLNYISLGRISDYDQFDIPVIPSTITEGARGNSRHPPENIIPSGAKKLEFSTESYEFYYHNVNGEIIIYVIVTDYHPGMLAVPVKKLREVIEYLEGE